MKKIFPFFLLTIFLFTLNISHVQAITSQDKITPAPVIQQACYTDGSISSVCTVDFTHSLSEAEDLREFICSVAVEKYGSEEALKSSPEAYLLSPSKLYLQIAFEGTAYITLKELQGNSFTISADEVIRLQNNESVFRNGIIFSLRVLLASSDFEERADSTVYIFTPSDEISFYLTEDRMLFPASIPLVFDKATAEDILLPLPKKTGYTFDGWSGADAARIRLIPKGTENITLIPHWLPKTYEINYKITTRNDMNYSFVGADNGLNPVNYTVGIEQKINPLNTPDVRFIFGGWYYNSDFSGDPVTEIKPGETGDKILYAKWISLEEKAQEERLKHEEYIREKKYGDIDGDGKVTASDARGVLRMVVGLDFPDPELLRRVDFDGTSTVSSLSARTVLRIAVGLDDMYAILLENGMLP